MGITITFQDYEEMLSFAEKLVNKSDKTEEGTSVPNPVLDTVTPISTVPTTVPVTPPTQTPTAGAPASAPVPVSTNSQTYALDDLARAAMALMDTGRQVDLQRLLSQFGVEALPALPREQYGAFATALRGMGARI